MNRAKKKIVIVHFQPVEHYPPVQNLIQFFQDNLKDTKVYVITTEPSSDAIQRFVSPGPRIKIIRLGKSGMRTNKINRVLQYLYFNAGACWQLCSRWPKNVLYFETLSSFPVYIYKRFLRPLANVIIHYHEYTSPREYREGMAMEKIFHRLEHYLYPKAVWVSHTNKDRLQQFLADIAPTIVQKAGILPNYPPASWLKKTGEKKRAQPLQVVYTGALGIDTMYIKEFAEWAEAQQGAVQWDIYSQQDGADLVNFLRAANFSHVTFKGNVSYHNLPSVLSSYDVGVILYKGHIPNYIYNAPNKLFEYTACGLDVWFPEQMKGSLPYITSGTFPKIIALNFENLHEEITPAVLSHEGMLYSPPAYNFESVLPALLPYIQ